MNHTLIISTRNRPQWIEHSLSFYKHFNYKGEIYITDDSDELNFEKNFQIIENFKNFLKISHEQGKGFKLEKRHKRFILTKYEALKKITTDFYTHISDDDFLYPNFLVNASNFLEKNKDYSAVNGVGIIVYLNSNFEIEKQKNLRWPSNEEHDPIDRLMKYCEPEYATQPMMAVCRTLSLKSLFTVEKILNNKTFTRTNTEGLELVDEEITWASQILISGKLKSLPEVSQFVIKTTPNVNLKHDDRVENYKFNAGEKFKVFKLGSIENILNNTMTPALKESKLELIKLVSEHGSKYSDEIIDDQISYFLWKIISASDGSLNFDKSDFFIKYKLEKELRNKSYFNFKIINIFKITNLAIKLKKFIIRKRLNLKINKFHKIFADFHKLTKINLKKYLDTNEK